MYCTCTTYALECIQYGVGRKASPCLPLPPLASPCIYIAYIQGEAFLLVEKPPLVYIFIFCQYTMSLVASVIRNKNMREKMSSTIGLTSYARNSHKKQYLIFGEMRNIFSFAYLSAIWLPFRQNPIEIIIDKIFVLDFAKIVTKQLINKQN